MNRREFINTSIRSFILAGVVTLSGYMLLKEKGETSCELDFACKNCKRLDSCDLPEARKIKSKS